ncbi:hypothetical protein ACLESD_42835, partial [Pyxidicoccus sp. 3LFB2]
PVGSERVIGVPPVPAQEPGAPSRPSSIFPPKAAPPHGVTQAFGAVPAIPPLDSQGAVPPPSAASQGPGIGRTALFGATAPASGQDAGIQLPPEPSESPAPVGSSTLLSFGPASQGPGAAEPVSGTGSTLRRPAVELPPELLAASRASSGSGGRQSFDSGRPAGRERLLPIVIVAGLVLRPCWPTRPGETGTRKCRRRRWRTRTGRRRCSVATTRPRASRPSSACAR